MLGSITPLGERGRNSKWGITVLALISGAVLAGASLGALLGLAGHLISISTASERLLIWCFALCVAVGIAMDLRLFGLRVPTIHRQVNDSWMSTYRGWVYGFGFGLQLGVGVATIVRSAALYLALLAALLSASPALGSLLMGEFGLTRGATVLSVYYVDKPELLWRVDRFLNRTEKLSRLSVAAIQVVVLASLMVVLA